MAARRNRDYDFVVEIPAVRPEPDLERYPSVDVSISVAGDASGVSDELRREVTEIIRGHLRATAARRLAEDHPVNPGVPSYFRVRDDDADVELTLNGAWPAAADDPSEGLEGLVIVLKAIAELARLQALTRRGSVCICAVGGGPPGAPQDGTKLLEVFNQPVPPEGYWLIGVYFPEDALLLELAGNPTLPAGQTDITLRSTVGWAKRISAWTFCAGTSKTIEHPGAKGNIERTMRLTRASCDQGDADLIFFSKPKFFGIWHDMYHWSGMFWPLHDRRHAIYTWKQE